MSSTFAPVYHVLAGRESYIDRTQKHEGRKRRRVSNDSDEASADDLAASDASSSSDVNGRAPRPRIPHPVNKKDPFYVAGHPRTEPLPGGNFPHAPVPTPAPSRASIEEELAKLKLFPPRAAIQEGNTSLRNRHLDNLTAILHKSILNQDWERANRAWGILLRIESYGLGMDVRHHGRWTIGAELLMRRNTVRVNHRQDGSVETAISEEGFRLARDYYERLILQYPHRPHSYRSTITANVIYPALFNIWIYEVQDRSKKKRRGLERRSTSEDRESESSLSSLASRSARSSESSDLTSDQRRHMRRIKLQEIAEAEPIIARLDTLMLNPPYDANPELRRLRGMVGLWIADLHEDVSASISRDSLSPDEDDEGTDSVDGGKMSAEVHREQAQLIRAGCKEFIEESNAASTERSGHISQASTKVEPELEFPDDTVESD